MKKVNNDVEHKFNIMQISQADKGGGAEKCAFSLHNEYIKQGYKSYLVVGEKKTNVKNIISLRNKNINIKIKNYTSKLLHIINKKFNPDTNSRYNFDSTTYRKSNLILKISSVHPSIIHCHNLHGRYFDIESIPELSKKVPMILNLHDEWTITGHCAYPCTCDQWKNGCGQCPDLNLYPPIDIDITDVENRRKKNIYHNSRLYITLPSKWLLSCINESILEYVMYSLIPYGIDLKMYQQGDKLQARRMLNLPSDCNIILFSAHSIYKNKRSMENAVMEYISSSNQYCMGICLGVKQDDIIFPNGRIKYIGKINDEILMSRYYKATDIYLHIAIADNLPFSIIEAMASGAAVIASSTGGIPELIDNDINGILIPHNDYHYATYAISNLLTNPQKLIELGKNAEYYALLNHDMNIYTNKMLNYYSDVINDWQQWNKTLQTSVI